VVSQPFTLRFIVFGCRTEYVPDVAVFHDDGLLVVDVRPGGRGSEWTW
jgi:hypothetical protein